MTEQPDPTRELDMSELTDAAGDPDVPPAGEQDVVEGEPGWEGGGDEPSA
jgi:hypothetical protein